MGRISYNTGGGGYRAFCTNYASEAIHLIANLTAIFPKHIAYTAMHNRTGQRKTCNLSYQGRIQDVRKGGAYAQLLQIYFATSPTNCACASSTWLLLLVGVVDVECPAQFNISANVQMAMAITTMAHVVS